MIREIRIKNFKSVESLKLELGRFNVMIGSNGSGKSNILEAITFGSAVTSVKLTNEFLTTRGIRTTEPGLMLSAFSNQSLEEAIVINFLDDKNENVGYNIGWFAETETWVGRNSISYHDESGGSSIFGGYQLWSEFKDFHLGRRANALNQWEPESKFVTFALDQLSIREKFIEDNALSNFLIFAPENYFLRNVDSENQIKPLGIRGEGLIHHLAKIGLKNSHFFEEIKEGLKLIEWFDDIEFDRAADGYFTGRIKIKDIYLEDGIKTFDLRSANEGFLYLLFYLTLFISDETPKFFAIDNIDNALNLKLASDLMQVLYKLAIKHDKQVIFTTHNPAILDGLNLNDSEQRLFVVSRNAEGRTQTLRIEKKPTPENGHSVKLSEQFLRGYIGGLNF